MGHPGNALYRQQAQNLEDIQLRWRWRFIAVQGQHGDVETASRGNTRYRESLRQYICTSINRASTKSQGGRPFSGGGGVQNVLIHDSFKTPTRQPPSKRGPKCQVLGMFGGWSGSTPSTIIILLELAPAVLVGTNKPVSHNIPQERFRGCLHLVVGLVPTASAVEGEDPSTLLSLRAAGQSMSSLSPCTCIIDHTYCFSPILWVPGRRRKLHSKQDENPFSGRQHNESNRASHAVNLIREFDYFVSLMITGLDLWEVWK